jgi:PAS domain S-box-containing protein
MFEYLLAWVVTGATNSMTQANSRLQIELQEQLRFDTLISDLSARFISMPADQVDSEVEDAQRRVCDCLGFGASGLWQWEADNPNTLMLTHHHLPPGGPPVPEPMNAAEHFPWALCEMMAGRRVLFSSLDEVPESANRDVMAWRHYGVTSVAIFPLSTGGGVTFGAIAFHDMAASRTWSEPLVKRLELVAQVFANVIARERAERALRESEERLLLATEAADAGPWILDLQAGRFWVGDKTLELFGLPPGDSLDIERFFALVLAEDRQGVRNTLEQATKSQKMEIAEYRILRPDGQVRWIQSRGRMSTAAKGGAIRLMGITSDVTERKQTEVALRSSQARVASAVDVAGLGFYELGENEHVTFMDDRIRTMFGIPPEEEPRASDYWVTHIHPEDLPRVLQMSRELLEEGVREADAEYQYVHPSRGRLWFHHLARVLDRNAAGRAIRLLGVVQDITERKQAEFALKESEWRLSHTQHIAHIGSWDWSIGTNRLTCSDETYRILGVASYEPEVSWEAFLERVHPEDQDQVAEALRRALDGPGTQYSIQHRVVRTDGSERIVQERGEVVRDEEGKPVRMIGSLQDVTEHAHMEAESRQLRTELAHFDRVNTVSVMTSALAHEINQPLAAILSNAQAGLRLLTRGRVDLDEIRELLHDIVQDDKRAGEVIRRLRAMLKQKGPQPEEFELNQVVREVVGLLHSEVVIRKVSLVMDLAPDPLIICADPVQVQQVIINLLLNALDAVRDEPRPRQEIVLSTRADAVKGVLLMVRDSGPGIPPDCLEAIFNPFYTTKTHGMGLGLAICRSITQVYRGTLVAKNTPGGGAQFILSFPAVSP